jgi:CRISPR-associated protein Cmr2
MSEAKSNLFLFSIGPVQRFIESARKAQDLWAGSYLLSHLIYAARDEAAKKPGINIIFPMAREGRSRGIAAAPNHLLLTLTGREGASQIRKLGEDLAKSVRRTFEEIARYATEELGKKKAVEDLAKRQIADTLEIYWAAVPVGASYAVSYERAILALSGRKSLKMFSQTEEDSLKCSLCGERQALHEKGKPGIRDTKAFWSGLAGGRRFGANEYLCTVCLGKRFAPDYFKNAKFPSTAEVAASPYKRHLRRALSAEFTDFENSVAGSLGKNGTLLPSEADGSAVDTLDGHWLYPENYSSKSLRNNGIHDAVHSDLTKKYQDFKTAVAERLPKLRLSSYYAVLVMDADKMGKKLSHVEFAQHRTLSSSLAEFAQKQVVGIVEGREWLGKLVYSGGDDLLAFVCLDHLLPMMEELRTTFACHMNERFPELTAAGSEPFSLSAGACVSHYKHPLRTSLKTARQMLKLAKDDDVGRRNAFALAIVTSGNRKQAVAPWALDMRGMLAPVSTSLQALCSFLRDGVLSDHFIYALREEFWGLINPDTGKMLSPPDGMDGPTLVKAELGRLLRRTVNESDYERVFGSAEVLWGVLDRDMNLMNFISLLETARFINREATL